MKNHWMKTALLAALTAAAAGCGGRTQAPRERKVRVRTGAAAADTLAQSREYIGVIEEETASVLSFSVPGTVKRISVREGMRVRRGELLAELETANLRSAHEAAQATLHQAEDAMRRLQQLYDKGSLAEIQYVEAQTKLAQARSVAEIAAENLADSRLTAPFDGVIGRRSADAGENVMAGQPVLTLFDTHTVHAKIAVPESEIASLRTGDRAVVRVAALGDRTFEGTITERGVAGNALSHTYEARIRLRNGDGALLPGMVCSAATLDADAAPAIVLPVRAVQVAHTGSRYVWTVRDGRAVRTEVVAGALTARGAVILAGLRSGDRVITEGAHKVGEGTKVEEL